MSSGERPIGAAKGEQSDTEALCQPPPPHPCVPLCTAPLPYASKAEVMQSNSHTGSGGVGKAVVRRNPHAKRFCGGGLGPRTTTFTSEHTEAGRSWRQNLGGGSGCGKLVKPADEEVLESSLGEREREGGGGRERGREGEGGREGGGVHIFFGVQTKMSWRSPLTSQYSR